jgi:tetratricopeptide (TPR) repeat protein
MNALVKHHCFVLGFLLFSPFLSGNDYFKQYAKPIKVSVTYLQSPAVKPMELLAIDPTKGIIFARMQGGGNLQLELRGLRQQNINKFRFEWSRNTKVYLSYLANEQYDPRILDAIRPEVYSVMLFLDLPFEYLAIHDDCLTYVQALVAMKQFEEAYYILERINLSKLDKFGYREFSEAALELCGQMISANPKMAEKSLGLLAKVSIRADNSDDHASYLNLCDALRKQGLYLQAIKEYGRLGPIVAQLSSSPLSQIIKLWPIYCYLKISETYEEAAKKDERYAPHAKKMFNTAFQGLKKIDESPPSRQSNEYSLYKLIHSLVQVYNARQEEISGNDEKAAAYYRQSVLEVTEGIVNARIGLDWLPESLLMAGDAYENLELQEAARNVYNQVKTFFPNSKWDKLSTERLSNLPQS